MATLTGSDFDPVKWSKTGRYRTMEGKRAHSAMDPETGATILIVESPADAEAYEATKAALARSVAWIEGPRAEPMHSCEGCGAALSSMEAARWGVCMPCTRARHRAALSHRCSCRKAEKRPKRCRIGSRVWEACQRCLGSIRQIS